MRTRGLKCNLCEDSTQPNESRSYADAWIEIRLPLSRNPAPVSRSYADAWIEIRRVRRISLRSLVVLLVERVD